MTTLSVTGHYLELRSDAHQKFYQVFITENNVLVRRWGRIGSPTGQFNVNVFTSYEDTQDQGLKSLYEKRGKGYTEVTQRVFTVDEEVIDDARRENLTGLISAYQRAAAVSDFEEQSTTVLGQYEKFAGRVQTLMDEATRGEADIIDTMEKLGDLKRAWAGIQEKHAEVQMALDIAESAVTQRLLSGAQ
jgi:predicted DNA-binding WGR domain protein